jgi:hypothetical protein
VGLFFLSFLSTVEAQRITLSPDDVFDIPSINGTIQFSVNGSYASAFLDNDTWIFTNLTLSGSRVLGTLKFSAKNCHVVIHSFTPNRNTGNNSRSSCYIRYTVEGTGEQVMNLGFDPSRPSHGSEWSVFNQNSVFFGEGQAWKLLPGDTVAVKNLSGHLTVMRYSYGFDMYDDRAFYLRHSVSISTGIILVVTVAFATVIKLKSERKKVKEVLN